jgi:uncharacterized repeat protein (TIGR01451 family)
LVVFGNLENTIKSKPHDLERNLEMQSQSSRRKDMNAPRIVYCLVLLLALATMSTYAQSNLVTVKIVINGTGTGSVTSLPLGTVDCSSSCSVQVPVGTNLTLHAAPATGSSFMMWTGACSGVADCNLTTSSAEKTVTATFNPPTAQLNLSVIGLGTGKVIISAVNMIPNFACTRGSSNCLQTFPKGTTVHLHGVADNGSLFSGWGNTGSNPCTVTELECSFTLNDSIEMTAVFGWAVPHNGLQVNTAGTTGGVGGRIFSITPEGAIDCGSTCLAFIPNNQAFKLLAVPDANSSVAGWSDENGQFITDFCSTDVTCDVPIGENGVRVTFKANPQVTRKTLKVSANPPIAGHFEINPKPDCDNAGCGFYINGYINPNPISIQVFNDAGYEFVGWSSKSGIPCTKTASFCSFELKSTYDLTANYVTVASISADLQASLQVPATVAALEEFQVTATLHNAGPVEASNIKFTLVLPDGVNFISGSSSYGLCRTGFSCAITGLASGSSATIQLRLRAPSTSGTLQWNAGASSLTPDPTQGDRTASATTQVTGGTALSLSATKSTNSPADGTALKGAGKVPMLAFKLMPSGTDVFELKGISLKSSGTGKDNTDLLDVQLYQDTNQNALVDAGEPLLSSNGFETDDGSVSLSINPGNAIASAGSSYLVTVNFNTILAAQHFSSLGLGLAGLAFLGLLRRKWRGLALGLLLSSALVSCPEPAPTQDLRTYQISLTEMYVTASSQTITTTGLPLTGAIISVAK